MIYPDDTTLHGYDIPALPFCYSDSSTLNQGVASYYSTIDGSTSRIQEQHECYSFYGSLKRISYADVIQAKKIYKNAGWTVTYDNSFENRLVFEKEFSDGYYLQLSLSYSVLNGYGGNYISIVKLPSEKTSSTQDWSEEMKNCMKDNFAGRTLPFAAIGTINNYESFRRGEIAIIGAKYEISVLKSVQEAYQNLGFDVRQTADENNVDYLEMTMQNDSDEMLLVTLKKSDSGCLLYEATID